MPHSLRVRLKNLQRKGELTEKDIDRIFKALEQEPCEDTVSRKEIIEHYTTGEMANVHHIDKNHLLAFVEQLPPVRPQEQTKEEHLDVFEVANAPWIFLDNCANSGYYCSKCKKKLVKEGWSETVKKINYCPNCGVRMESEDKHGNKK